MNDKSNNLELTPYERHLKMLKRYKKIHKKIKFANALRFEGGTVLSVDTDRIGLNNKRWRGRTAD